MINVPTREALKAGRAYSKDTLKQEDDCWGNMLGEDSKGVYVIEQKIVPGSVEFEAGEKVYVEDFYNFIEQKILDLHEESCELHAKLAKQGSSEDILLLVGVLMRNDAILQELHMYHSNPPSGQCFSSNKALEEIIEKVASDFSVLDYLIAAGQYGTPLGLLDGSMFGVE